MDASRLVDCERLAALLNDGESPRWVVRWDRDLGFVCNNGHESFTEPTLGGAMDRAHMLRVLQR